MTVRLLSCEGMADSVTTVLADELAQRTATWPRDAGIVAAAQTGERTGACTIGSITAAGEPPAVDTLYRIASISKVFTALALAVAVRRGEVRLDQPANRYLPDPIRLPHHHDRPILVEHLATHTAALPRDHLGPDSVDGLAATLARIELSGPPGRHHLYSNLGVAVLGQLLAHVAGSDYATLITDRICRPLRLPDTALTISPQQTERLAQGRELDGRPAAVPTIHLGAPSGGLYSTATDLLRFLQLHLGRLQHDELSAAAAFALGPRFTSPDGPELGLCWHRSPLPTGVTSIWHNGGLRGFHSYAALVPAADTTLVVLANHDIDLETAATGMLSRLTG